MRGLLMLLVAGALAWGIPSRSEASLTELPFEATLTLQLSDLDPLEIPASGTASVDRSETFHLNGFSLDAGVFSLQQTIQVGRMTTIEGVILDVANAQGSFAALSGGDSGGGDMPLSGSAVLCLFVTCDLAGDNLRIVIPLGVVGHASATTITANLPVIGEASLRVEGAPWTVGSVNVPTANPDLTPGQRMGIQITGFASPVSSAAQPSGRVQLVTPVFITTSIPDLSIIPAWAELEIHFVPEPAALLLLGAGVVGLAFLGRRRIARR